jgi:hypothetical protein
MECVLALQDARLRVTYSDILAYAHAPERGAGLGRLTFWCSLVVTKALSQRLDPIVACPSEFASADRHDKVHKVKLRRRRLG